MIRVRSAVVMVSGVVLLLAVVVTAWAGSNHGKRPCRIVPANFNPGAVADRRGKFLQLLDQRVRLCGCDAHGFTRATLQEPQTSVEVIVGRGILAVDIHQVVLRC